MADPMSVSPVVTAPVKPDHDNAPVSTAEVAALFRANRGKAGYTRINFETQRLLLKNQTADGVNIQTLSDDFIQSPEFKTHAKALSQRLKTQLSPVQRKAFEAELDKRNILEGKLERLWEHSVATAGHAIDTISNRTSRALADKNRALTKALNNPHQDFVQGAKTILEKRIIESLQKEKGIASGEVSQVVKNVGEMGDTAKLAYKLSTDAHYRDTLTGMAALYYEAVKKDPGLPLSSLQKAGKAAYKEFEDGLLKAQKAGREAEYLGEREGKLRVEAALMIVPVSKLAKLGKFSKLLDRVSPGKLSKLSAFLGDLKKLAPKTVAGSQALAQTLKGMLGIAQGKGEVEAFVVSLKKSNNLTTLLDAGEFNTRELNGLLKRGKISEKEHHAGLQGLGKKTDLAIPEKDKTNSAGLSAGKVNNLIGKFGEAHAVRYLLDEGYSDIITLQNRNNHGIDLVALDKQGKITFIEAKGTIDTGKVPVLSGPQKQKDFVTTRFKRALGSDTKFWKNADPAIKARAEDIRDLLRDNVKTVAIKLDVYLDKQGGLAKPITSSHWQQDLDFNSIKDKE